MSSSPLLSVIVSVYNSEKFIRGILDDLFQQSIIEQCEIIIINSGSPQNEEPIILEFAAKYSNLVYIKTEERETLYEAWNRGLNVARGEFFTNANTDDRLAKTAYEKMTGYLLAHPDIAVVYGDQYYSFTPNEKFDSLVHPKLMYFSRYSRLRLLDICHIGSQPMWRKSCVNSGAKIFNGAYEVAGDWDLYLRLAQTYKFKKLPFVSGSFYKPIDKSNKEAQNFLLTFYEGNTISLHYIQQYIFELSTLKQVFLLFRYLPLAVLPFNLYRVIHKVYRTIRKDHVLNHEFVYLLVVLCLKNFHNENLSAYFARKFLKFNPSIRLEAIIQSIEKHSRHIVTLPDFKSFCANYQRQKQG